MVSIRFLLLFIGGLFCGSISLTGQWRFSGHVSDAETGEALSYVSVIAGPTAAFQTTTDQQGNFEINGLTEEQYQISFVMIGFRTFILDSVSATTGDAAISMTPESFLADEVVISASRKSQYLKLAPASVSLVTSEQIKQQGLRSFEEALTHINGVLVTRSGKSNVQSVSIRGASETAGGGIGNRVLLLLDGRPAITPESGGALWNLVPLAAVERIEVIKGAYSSLFGSSAMGGIVNIITREPKPGARTTVNMRYGVYQNPPAFADFTGYHDYYTMDATHSNIKGRWSYLFNGAVQTDNGFREKTAFDLYNGFGKIKFALSANRSLTFSAMYNDINNDTPATWLSAFQPYNVAPHRLDDTQHKREINADLLYQAFAHSHIKYTSRFYYYNAYSEYAFNADPENDSTNINFGKQFVDYEDVRVHRIGNVSQIDVQLNQSHYLISGFELQSDYVNGTPDTVLYGEHKAWNAGVYAQDEITIGPKWTVTAGMRYDFYRIYGTFMESNLSPKIATVYRISNAVSIRALGARAYRNPSIAERYTKFEQGGGLRFVVSPFLRAEKLTLSTEIGGNIDFGEKLNADIAIYYNRYKDLISYVQRSFPGEPLRFEVINLNKAIMQGFEIGLTWKPIQKLTMAAGYNYLDARDASPARLNDALPYKSKHTAYANAVLHLHVIQLSLQSRYRSRIDEVFIYPGSEPDGYVLFSGRLGAKISDTFSAHCKVDNITDVKYEEIERYRMPGRTFEAGLSMTF